MKIADIIKTRIVSFAKNDEASWGLLEVEATPDDGIAAHRFQLTYVRRMFDHEPEKDYQLCVIVEDLGLAIGFTYPPLRVITFGDDTVGEVRDMAGELKVKHTVVLPDPNENFGVEEAENLARTRERYLKRTQFGAGQIASIEQRN